MSSITGLAAAQAAMPQIQDAYNQALAAAGGDPSKVPDAFTQGLASAQQNLSAWQNAPQPGPTPPARSNQTAPFPMAPNGGAFGGASTDIPGAFNTTSDAYNQVSNAYQQALVAAGGDPSKVPDAFKTGMDTANKNMGAWADAYRTSDPTAYQGAATNAAKNYAVSASMLPLQWVQQGIANGTLVNNNGRITAPDGSSPANPYQSYMDSAFAPFQQAAEQLGQAGPPALQTAYQNAQQVRNSGAFGAMATPQTPSSQMPYEGYGYAGQGGYGPTDQGGSYYGPYVTPGASTPPTTSAPQPAGGPIYPSSYGSFYPPGNGQGAFSQFQQPYQAPQSGQNFFQ